MSQITPILTEALKGAVMITGLVIIMMLLIEFLNIESHGKTLYKLRTKNTLQVIVGTLLGIIPGCVGGFAAVSLYTHSVIGFGALIAAMIASTGDEAFVMAATSPKSYLIVIITVSLIAIVTGLIINLIQKRRGVTSSPVCKEEFALHTDEDEANPSPFKRNSYRNLLSFSWRRAVIIIGILLFIVAMLTGLIDDGGESTGRNDLIGKIFNERWINILFAVISLFTLLMTATAKEHFIREHIWDHLLKKHLPGVFLWTLGALIVCGILTEELNIESWISTHSNVMPLIVLASAAIGLIPQSGPHMIFILLCTQGTLPLYILIVSAISQQGHVSLPLLAESKKHWIVSKSLCAVIAIAVGMVCYLIV